MVLIMWLTGGKKPQPAAKTTTQAAPPEAPLEVNQTQINELQSRIEELQRQQLVAQNALTQQTRLLGAAAQGLADPEQQPSTSGSPATGALRRCNPVRAEKAAVSIALRIECGFELSQASLDHQPPANGEDSVPNQPNAKLRQLKDPKPLRSPSFSN